MQQAARRLGLAQFGRPRFPHRKLQQPFRSYARAAAPKVVPAEPASNVEREIEPESNEDTIGIIPALSRIQQILGSKLEFPRVVVVGNQSAGKSSVVESIVGADILPKGSNMVTTRPLELTLVREQSGTWAEFPGGAKMFDIKEIRDRLHDENKDTPFSTEPIRMEFHSPEVHNVTLIDLPGYILAIKQDQDKELPKHIKKLCESYIQNPNNLVVCVVSASEDVAMSVGLKESRKYDTLANRTMGVLTKIDLRPPRDIIHTLRNNDYPLPLGYIGIMCRTTEAIEAGIDIKKHLVREEDFIQKKKLRPDEAVRVGTPVLRSELSSLLLGRISSHFPSIIEQLERKIRKSKADEQFLVTISKEKDLTKVAKELEKLVNAFHPASPTRLEFERDFRLKLADLCNRKWDEAVNSTWGELKTEITQDLRGQSHLSNKSIATQKKARQLLTSVGFESSSTVPLDYFSNFLIYGDGSPEKLEDFALAELDRGVLSTALNTPFYSSFLPQDFARQKLQWQSNLAEAVDGVLEHNGLDIHGLADEARKLCLDELVAFVDNFAKEVHHKDQDTAKLARFFFRYLLEQVSQRTDSENLTKSIHALLKREKRAQTNYFDLVHAIREVCKYPIEDNSVLFGDTRPFPVAVPAYGDVWTKAYFEIVKRRTTDDTFRLLAVDLINPLIFETIHYSLSLFKSGRVFREASKQLKHIQDLEKYRNVIVEASKKYGNPAPAGSQDDKE